MTAMGIKLWLALVFLVALVAAPSIIAYRAVLTVNAHYALTDASAQSLNALQRLTLLGYTLQQERFVDPQGFARERGTYVDGVRAHVANAERYLDAEIRLIGKTNLPAERRAAAIKEELQQREQVRLIGLHLERALLADGIDTRWEDVALQAISNEAREGKATQRLSMETFRNVIYSLLVTSMVVGGLGLVTVIWVQRQVIRPLAGLWHSTRAIARGDYSHRAPAEGTRQIRTIASSFNVMAEQVEAAAQSLRQTNEGLERAVARRTEELAATNRSLERANRLRQQFLADASHELRTPLSIMRSEAEITLRDPGAGPEILRSSLDRVVRLCVLMGEMIDDMLLIARAEEPLLQTNTAPVDAVATVRHCIEDFRRVIEADGGHIVMAPSAESLMIEADETRLQQVIRIVVDNAVSYSSGAPEVEMSVVAEDGEAIITVTDHGDGIAAEDIPHLFQRFRRGGTKAGKGQGLGLSIARSITETMGGTIGLTSRLHEGTSVSIRFPLMPEAIMADGAPS